MDNILKMLEKDARLTPAQIAVMTQRDEGDIKNAIDAPFLLSELLHYWPWAVGAIVVAALIFVGIYLYHKYRNQ